MLCDHFARDLVHYVGRSGMFSAFSIVLSVLHSGVWPRTRVA
jgi:hypothetical protein